MAELVRGKTGRVYGDLIALLTVLKGLPLAYNKDMQEDKESVFDACDTVKACIGVFNGMIKGMRAKPENMLSAAKKGFINATDVADYLTKRESRSAALIRYPDSWLLIALRMTRCWRTWILRFTVISASCLMNRYTAQLTFPYAWRNA